MKKIAIFFAICSWACLGACTKKETDSPFIGNYSGKYTEVASGTSVSLDNVTVVIQGKAENNLEVRIGLSGVAFNLEAQIIDDTDIFFPPQDLNGDEVSGSGALAESEKKLTIELETTDTPAKTVRFEGTRL